MPSKTPKQARTMRAAAHNPAFAKRMGIPKKVAEEFTRADAASVMPAKARSRKSRPKVGRTSPRDDY